MEEDRVLVEQELDGRKLFFDTRHYDGNHWEKKEEKMMLDNIGKIPLMIRKLDNVQRRLKSINMPSEVYPLGDDCYEGDGRNYLGTRNTTSSGLECQRWDTDVPINKLSYARYAENFPDSDIKHNFCRNPEGQVEDGEPWCYINDQIRRFEPCGIPKCRLGVMSSHGNAVVKVNPDDKTVNLNCGYSYTTPNKDADDFNFCTWEESKGDRDIILVEKKADASENRCRITIHPPATTEKWTCKIYFAGYGGALESFKVVSPATNEDQIASAETSSNVMGP